MSIKAAVKLRILDLCRRYDEGDLDDCYFVREVEDLAKELPGEIPDYQPGDVVQVPWGTETVTATGFFFPENSDGHGGLKRLLCLSFGRGHTYYPELDHTPAPIIDSSGRKSDET